MTKEERMAKIQTKAANDRKAEEDKANAAKAEYDRLAGEIKSLSERIGAVLDLADFCLKNGVEIPFCRPWGKQERYGPNARAGFYADGVTHNVGFDCKWGAGRPHPIDGEIPRLSIRNGGYNGPYNFYANDMGFWWEHEDRMTREREGICREPKSWKYDMEKFIKEFPLFEAAFYSWVDSLA